MTRATIASAGARRGYRRYLDGLRTLAVLAVVAFHSGVGPAGGGFIGVDVFFVLSGYLVTGLLVAELGSTDRLVFRRFYARRMRRLLPLSMLVLVVTAVFFVALSPPAIVREAEGSFVAAFLYVANWWFIAESTEYLGSNIEASPILHFWSLAIEEQFYAVWPLAIYLGHRVFRRAGSAWPIALAGVVTVLAAASLILALVVAAGDLDRAYYGTDTRAYQLLLGAALALLPVLPLGRLARGAGPALAAAGVAVVVVLATDLVDLSPITRGAWAAAATALIIVVLEAGGGGLVERALSVRPMVEIGKISYGIYLWHLPVMYVLAEQYDLQPVTMLLVATPVTLALSWASAKVVETPIRRTPRLDPMPLPTVAVGLTLSLLGGLVVAPAILSPRGSTAVAIDDDPDPSPADTPPPTQERASPSVSTTGPVELVDWEVAADDRADVPDCRATDPSECTVVHGPGPHVLLIGDSHARVWASALVPFAETHDLTLSVASVGRCSWHLDAMVAIGEDVRDECYARQHEWIDEIVPALDPDVVVLTHRATFDPARPFIADDRRFIEAATTTIDRIRAEGAEVVIFEPLPIADPDHDPLVCLSEGRTNDECSFTATPATTVLEDHYRRLAADPDVWSVDVDDLACPALPRCDAIVDRIIVWRDLSHMTATYAATLADDLADRRVFTEALERTPG